MAKTLLRFNRQPRGTVAKIERIVKDLNSNPPRRDLSGASGARIFAVWSESRR